jgi:hypothetical protein
MIMIIMKKLITFINLHVGENCLMLCGMQRQRCRGQWVLGCGGLHFKIATECSGNFIINAYRTFLLKKEK